MSQISKITTTIKDRREAPSARENQTPNTNTHSNINTRLNAQTPQNPAKNLIFSAF